MLDAQSFVAYPSPMIAYRRCSYLREYVSHSDGLGCVRELATKRVEWRHSVKGGLRVAREAAVKLAVPEHNQRDVSTSLKQQILLSLQEECKEHLVSSECDL